jgi:hypothetical protein
MHTSESTDKLFSAIAKAQAEMPAVAKSSTNPHFNSKFAPLDAVHKAAQPILAKHGLALLAVTSAADGEAVTMVRLQCGDQWLECTLAMKPRSTDQQQIGSCNTYARRYLYGMLFGLVTEEDTDGNDTAPEKPRKAPAKKKPPAYTPALNEATKANITALAWNAADCLDWWDRCGENVDGFRQVVAQFANDLRHAQGATE